MTHKITMKRDKSQEMGQVHLWFSDAQMNYVASVVGSPGDIRTRITTPKGRKEFGMVFAARDEFELRETMKNVEMWKKSIARQLDRMGYKASSQKKGIVVQSKAR